MTRGRDSFGCGSVNGQADKSARPTACAQRNILDGSGSGAKKPIRPARGQNACCGTRMESACSLSVSLNRREPPLRSCAESAKLCKRKAPKFEMRVDL